MDVFSLLIFVLGLWFFCSIPCVVTAGIVGAVSKKSLHVGWIVPGLFLILSIFFYCWMLFLEVGNMRVRELFTPDEGGDLAELWLLVVLVLLLSLHFIEGYRWTRSNTDLSYDKVWSGAVVTSSLFLTAAVAPAWIVLDSHHG